MAIEQGRMYLQPPMQTTRNGLGRLKQAMRSCKSVLGRDTGMLDLVGLDVSLDLWMYDSIGLYLPGQAFGSIARTNFPYLSL